jgi:hypothetical protein
MSGLPILHLAARFVPALPTVTSDVGRRDPLARRSPALDHPSHGTPVPARLGYPVAGHRRPSARRDQNGRQPLPPHSRGRHAGRQRVGYQPTSSSHRRPCGGLVGRRSPYLCIYPQMLATRTRHVILRTKRSAPVLAAA